MGGVHKHLRHNLYGTKVYRVWGSMIQRCDNPKNAAYAYYGGRGINVCKEWHDFAVFYSDVGDRADGLTLDRIDNNGNYEPGNVRWVSMSVQHENMRGVVWYEYKGETKTLTAWAKHFNVHREVIRGRMRRGATFAKAIELEPTPIHKHTFKLVSGGVK